MRYRIEVYYQNEVMAKVTKWMGEIMPGWGKGKKELIGQRDFEFDTPEPLSDELIQKIQDNCPDWAEEIRVISMEG